MTTHVLITRFVLDVNGAEIEWTALPPYRGMTIEKLIEMVNKLTGGES